MSSSLTSSSALISCAPPGRIRDLVAVPPERRVLVESRSGGGKGGGGAAVAALSAERVVGLSEVMLVLDRAVRAAAGPPLHPSLSFQLCAVLVLMSLMLLRVVRY